MNSLLKIEKNKYPYRKGTLGIIFDKNQHFLVVNKQAYKENEWSFAGGGIEENETPGQAILRELKEELGVNKFAILKLSSALCHYEWPDEAIIRKYDKTGKFYRGQQLQYFLIKFEGEPDEIKIQAEEIRKIKWVALSELPQYLIFPGQWESAQKILKEFHLLL